MGEKGLHYANNPPKKVRASIKKDTISGGVFARASAAVGESIYKAGFIHTLHYCPSLL